MKLYSLRSEFTFGKYEGKTLREVLDFDPSYIDWCSIHLDHFCICDEDIDYINSIFPGFPISEEGRKKLNQKYEIWEKEQNEIGYENNSSSHRTYDEDELMGANWDYDPYNPAHDPSENPWIDVFGPGDEAEEAYWNTD